MILKPVKPSAPVRARWNDWGNGSADNIRASGLHCPRKKEAEDMTAPTTGATLKIALDQRASSRHGGFGTDSGPSRGNACRRARRPIEASKLGSPTSAIRQFEPAGLRKQWPSPTTRRTSQLSESGHSRRYTKQNYPPCKRPAERRVLKERDCPRFRFSPAAAPLEYTGPRRRRRL